MTHLSIFEEFNVHLLKDERPSYYFQSLIEEGLFPQTYPFTMLSILMRTEQNPKHHPEGNVWQHTMQVVDAAAKYKHLSADPQVFMWTSLLHDIGKGPTTRIRNGKITAYDHDREGGKLSRNFLTSLTKDEAFIDGTQHLVRWHMQPLFVNNKLPFATLDDMIKQVSPAEVGLFSICDRLGRNPLTQDQFEEEIEFVKIFLNTCSKIVNDVEEKSKILKIIYHLTEGVKMKV